MAADTSSKRPVRLSVIVPVFNGEGFIAANLRELLAYLGGLGESSELIVVDDGCTDGSVAAIEAVLAGAPVPAMLLRHGSNRGKGAAIRSAMEAAVGEQRVFLDADLAYPPAEIGAVRTALAGGADVAVACRVHPDSRYLISPSFFRYLYTRHVAGRLFNWLARLLLVPGILDTQAGLKGFTAEAAGRLFAGWLPRGFGFDLALLVRARQAGLAIAQVPVSYRYDSEPTTVRFLVDAVTMLREIAAVRLRVGRADTPGRGLAPPPRSRHGARWPAALRAVPAWWLGALVAAGLAIHAAARLAWPSGSVALGAWLVALAGAGVLALRADAGRVPLRPRLFRQSWEVPIFLIILAGAAVLRFWGLAEAPAMLHPDSAECGLRGLEVYRGQAPDLFAFSSWYNTPFLAYAPYALAYRLVGIGILGLRLPSAVTGTLVLIPLYALVRGWYGARVALTATALFAVAHNAIHFSRIGLWNIQALLLAVTAFALLFAALRRHSRFWMLAAGVTAGLGLYTYTAGRLGLLLCGLFLAARLVRRRGRPVTDLAVFAAGTALAIVPLALSYVQRPDVLAADRTAAVWVLSERAAPHVQAAYGTDRPLPILARQTQLTLGGFVSYPDASGQYLTQQPVLSWPLAALALVGLAVTVRLARQPRNAFLLAWTVLGLLLGSVLIIDPPSQTRQVVTFPVPYILAALGLDAALRPVFRSLRTPAVPRALAATALLTHAAAFNLGGYQKFLEAVDLMPRGWDVAQVVQTLDPGSTVYVFAGPHLLADSPTLRFAARDQRLISGFTVSDVPYRIVRDTAFVLAQDYARIGVVLADRFPGIEREVQQRQGRPQYIVYRCTFVNGCLRSEP
jgi:dolichyl-phosphate beta-glucosyltransferase